MSRYKVEDSILDTDKAVQSWEEAADWNGNNSISRATGSQWSHETLYKSSKGRYWLERSSQYQGSLPSADVISDEEAAAWLLLMEHDLPEDLREVADKVAE